MNEKLLTAGIGIAFGIVIAIGIFFWFSRPKTNPLPPSIPPAIQTPTPKNFSIVIDSPSDGEIITETPLTVSGLATPGVTVVVTGPADEQIVKADAKGQFLTKLKLEEGENTITASVVDERGTLQLAKKQIILEISQQ